MKIDSRKFELLTKWYLRLNGYFTVGNFVIHAADDSTRISNGTVGNYTDIDVLGIRMPFHFEKTGELEIENDTKLNCVEKIDIIIAECKTGNQNGLNKIWTDKNAQAIEYLIKFCGIFKCENEIKNISSTLIDKLIYEDEKHRIRVVLFGETKPTDDKLNFISLKEILNFLIVDRGGCWTENDIGIKSIHNTWDNLINEIFKVSNNQTIDRENKENQILKILGQEDKMKAQAHNTVHTQWRAIV